MRHRSGTRLFLSTASSSLVLSIVVLLCAMIRLPRCHSLMPVIRYDRSLIRHGARSQGWSATHAFLGPRTAAGPRAPHHYSTPAGTLQGHRLSNTAGNKETTSEALDKNSTGESTETTSDDVLDWGSAITVADLLAKSTQLLEANDVMEPGESVVQLMAAALQLDWETGHRRVRRVVEAVDSGTDTTTFLAQQVLTAQERSDFTGKMQRRLAHEPIQYILGQWDFMDFIVQIERPLLCPRPETEELVSLVLHELKQQDASAKPRRILDIGCGTGCIGIALAASTELNIKVAAIDVEPVAVRVACANAASILGLDDWQDRYSAVLASATNYSADGRFDLVVSNPPYIPETDESTLTADVLKYESRTALISGPDGLDVIRTIVRRLPEWCVAGAICWMEVDPTHPAILREWLYLEQSDLGVEYVADYVDMFGRDRFVKLRVVETR